MSILEMRDMYQEKYSYTCEKCGKTVPFMQEFCGHCGNKVPADHTLKLTLKSYNLNKPLWERAKKLPDKLQEQIAERLKDCKTQAEINKKAQKLLDLIEAKQKQKQQ